MPAEKQSLRNVVVAKLLTDTTIGTTYDTPRFLAGALSAKVTPSVTGDKHYSDDTVSDVDSRMSDIAVEIATDRLSLDDRAFLLGHTVVGGVMKCVDGDEPPYVALGFLNEPSAGVYALNWLYKGKFQEMTDEYATATNNSAYRENRLVGTFVKRLSDNAWRKIADSATANVTVANWFTSPDYAPEPQIPETDPSNPDSDPDEGAGA